LALDPPRTAAEAPVGGAVRLRSPVSAGCTIDRMGGR